MKNDDLIERLAEQEHERWSGWMKYMFDNWVPENINRWKNQMITPYAELPEHSKESDRKEARKTMMIVGPIITQLDKRCQLLEDTRNTLELENERLRYAIFDESHDGKERLVPIHFEWWAESVGEARGYSGSELECLLRRLAALGGEQ